jgi:formylmethanofuran dehydrogenase subunit E
MGYRMTRAALHALGTARSEDEEIVAVVENDACGIDAVQFLSGCTFGKGNLIFLDYGKPVYTFYSRHSGEGVRVAWRTDARPKDAGRDRTEIVEWILQAPEAQVLAKRSVHIEAPDRAVIRASVVCEECGEQVMETRTRRVGNRSLCIPCWRNYGGAASEGDSS